MFIIVTGLFFYPLFYYSMNGQLFIFTIQHSLRNVGPVNETVIFIHLFMSVRNCSLFYDFSMKAVFPNEEGSKCFWGQIDLIYPLDIILQLQWNILLGASKTRKNYILSNLHRNLNNILLIFVLYTVLCTLQRITRIDNRNKSQIIRIKII